MITELQARRLTNEQIKEAIQHISKKYCVDVLHANYREYDMNLYMLVDNYEKALDVVADMTYVLIGTLDIYGNDTDEDDVDVEDEYCPTVQITDELERYNQTCKVKGGIEIL